MCVRVAESESVGECVCQSVRLCRERACGHMCQSKSMGEGIRVCKSESSGEQNQSGCACVHMCVSVGKRARVGECVRLPVA